MQGYIPNLKTYCKLTAISNVLCNGVWLEPSFLNKNIDITFIFVCLNQSDEMPCSILRNYCYTMFSAREWYNGFRAN